MNKDAFQKWCRELTDCSLSPSYNCNPLIMGVINVTPDSFSDGGRFLSANAASKQALSLIEQGADLVDIGGESTRPGAAIVSAEEEMERVIPVIEALRKASDVCISIDTYKASVMKEAVAAGANLINDIKALKDKNALQTAAQLNVPVCLMHMQGEPRSMQVNPHYKNHVVTEINSFFKERIDACLQEGIAKERLILDPGFGFGKTVLHNRQLLKNIEKFKMHQLPLMLGVSRKSTIGKILNKPVEERLIGGLAIATYAAMHGVSIIRTHDINETKQAFTIINAIRTA